MANHGIRAGRAAVFARATRWLAAAPADVVEFPARSAKTAAGSASGTLGDGLERWRATIVRTRLVVVARRSLTVAASTVAALLLLRLATGAPEPWLIVSVAVGALVGTGGVALLGERARDGLTLGRVARLLDRRLRLDERLGTAWELTARGDDGPLARGVVAEGDQLVWELLGSNRSRARRAPREWTALGVALVALLGLAVLGARDDGHGDGASVRADAAAAAQARARGEAGATRPAAGTTPPAGATTPRIASVPAAGATVPRAAAGATARRGATPADGAAATTRIAVRRRAARDASASSGSGAATSSGRRSGAAGSGSGGAARAGTGGSTRRGTPSDRTAAPGTVPTPDQVKEFSAQGRRASAPVAAGGAQATQRADAAARDGGRSGSRGAGRQAGQLGSGGAQQQSAAGSERLPLRMLATSGGREQGAAAGRAGTGGRGRGTARVQSGGAAGGTTAAGGTAAQPLPFVPTAVNAVAPYLRALVTTYFP